MLKAKNNATQIAFFTQEDPDDEREGQDSVTLVGACPLQLATVMQRRLNLSFISIWSIKINERSGSHPCQIAS